MKTTISFSLLCISTLNLHAQLNIKTNIIPACKPVQGDFLYLKETEVSNAEYKEFIQWLKTNSDTATVNRNHPDTLVWRSQMGYNEPFVHFYYQHPAYNDYPVVGISQNQAVEYCKWLRNRLLENFKKSKSPVVDIIVRLPTEKEWMNAARIGLNHTSIFPWEGESDHFSKGRKRDIGKIRLNYNRSYNGFGISDDMGFITTPVYAYWPSKAGFYNLSGNVAEWISEKGKTKGGSWKLPLYYSRIDVNGFEDGSTQGKCDVGFRYIVEIVKIKTDKPVYEKINAKIIEKEISQIDSTLFAGKYEVTNQWFNTFLHETGFKEFSPQDSLWLNNYNQYHYRLMYSSFDNTKNFPVVNISHKAAIAYCKWLTDKYNALPKRSYKKVIFHLPDEFQFYKAASSNVTTNTSIYPWAGPYVVNAKGQYLANFFPLPDQNRYIDSNCGPMGCYLPFDTATAMMADGYEFTTNVRSFQPNKSGLYNISGNAAEMLVDGKSVIGGSWNSNIYFLRLHNPKYYSREVQFERNAGPAPTTGFRVFMTILEK